MRVSSIPSRIWVAALALCWGGVGFYFAASEGVDTLQDPTALSRKAQLAQRADGEEGRILILGGSNAYYGLRAKTLARELARPVLNLALLDEGGDERLLWRFMDAVVHPGDTVVVSLVGTFVSYKRDPYLAADSDRILHQELGGRYKPQGFRKPLWEPFPVNPLGNRLLMAFSDPSSDPTVNEYGDGASLCSDDFQAQPRHDLTFQSRDSAYWQRLKAETDGLRAKGVSVVAVTPWVLVDEKGRSVLRMALQDAEKHYRKMDVPVLTPLEDSIRASGEGFCDFVHMNDKGAELRTKTLLEALRGLPQRVAQPD